MFKIIKNDLWYKDKLLGPKTALHLDKDELKYAKADGLLRHPTMPLRIDMVMCVGNKVVGIESKLPQDLIDSQKKRRLARQMRAIISTCDIACLMVRGLPDYMGCTMEYQTLWNDLVRLQALGVFLLPASQDHNEIVQQLAKYAEFFTNKKAPLAAISGNDRKKLKKSVKGYLMTGIEGLGSITAERLHEKFGSTEAALLASDAEWKEMKIGTKLLARRKRAMS